MRNGEKDLQTGEAIIFVAGNPALYPLEYYDAGSGSYRGAIPEFLQRFGEEYGYRVQYLEPGSEDRRAELAEARQVDIISGCLSGERYQHTTAQPLVLLTAEEGGTETAYALYLTTAAPEGLRAELREFAAATGSTQWTGALLAQASEGTPTAAPLGLLGGLGAAALLLACALIAALRAYRRERRRGVELHLTDAETGLGTEEALKEAFSHLERSQDRANYALLCFHLALDEVGRTWGREQAAALLARAAETLKAAGGPGDILAHCGGDIYALKRFDSAQGAREWAREVRERICAGVSGGRLREEDVTVGVHPLAKNHGGLEQTMFHAHQCALAAARDGTGERLCGTELCRSCEERWQLLGDFDSALERHEFQLYLQFFVDSYNFRMVGGEALSRWNHPRLGRLDPGRYIPLLEGDGRIGALDLYGLELTCAFLEELGRAGVEDFFISCNFARRTFSEPGFAGKCIEIVERHEFRRKLLIMEVTESQQLSRRQNEQMLKNIVEVRRHGVRVIFDDFGMGFSSFHDLQDYPMDGLKLDKELVDNMGTEQGKIILGALVETGHRMGLTILAEGVETDEEISALRELHCDVMQGFRFSFPLPAHEARRRILESRRPRLAPDGAKGEGE